MASNASLLQQNDMQFENENAAPNRVFPYGSSYVGAVDTSARSLLRGATVVQMQPSSKTHVIQKQVRIVNSFEAPRFVKSCKLSLACLEATAGDITIVTLPSVSNLYSGPVPGCEAGPDPAEGTDPFSGVGSLYASAFDAMDIERFVFPVGTIIGNRPLQLGGVLSLRDHLNKSGQSRGAKFMLSCGVSNHGDTDVLRDISELENESGEEPSNGYGVPCTWKRHIRVRNSVGVDPQDSESSSRTVFTIKKNTLWPGDYSIMDNATGFYITNPTVRTDCGCLSEGDASIFNADWIFDSDRYTIAEPIVLSMVSTEDLPVVVFSAGSKLGYEFSVNSTLELDTETDEDSINTLNQDITNGDVKLYLRHGSGYGIESTDEFTGEAFFNATGTDRDLLLFGVPTVISQGTYIPSTFVIQTGVSIPAGFRLPVGTTVIGASNEDPVNYDQDHCHAAVPTAQSKFLLSHVILDPGFVFADNYIFSRIVTEAASIPLPIGSYALTPLSIPNSSSWEEFSLVNAILSEGHVLAAPLTVAVAQTIVSDVELMAGSVLSKASVLAPDTVTGVGMKSSKAVTAAAGTVIKSSLSLSSSISTSEARDFVAGTKFGKSTALPTGAVISNGNTVPALLPILTSSGVVLAEGSIIENPILQPNFYFLQGTGFESGSEIPANSTISAGAVIPAGARYSVGIKLPFPLPLPAGVVFTTDSVIPAGTIFDENTAIPRIFGRNQQDLSDAANATKPFYFVTLDRVTYLVVKSKSGLLNGQMIPKGSVYLPTVDLASVVIQSGVPSFTEDVYVDDAWVAGNDTIVLNEGTWNTENRSLIGGGSTRFTIEQGVPTANTIYLLEDVILDGDFALRVQDSASVFDKIVFNVPFKTQVDTKPAANYLTLSDGRVFFPSGKDLTFEITSETDFTVPMTFSLTKKLVLPTSVECFVPGILDAVDTYIKFPPTTQRTHRKFKIGTGGLAIASGSGSKAGLSLPPVVNVVRTAGSGITLSAPLVIEVTEWLIESDLIAVPALTIVGLSLPIDAVLPADITFPANSALPSGISSQSPIDLVEDYIVLSESSPFRVLSGSLYGAGSVLAPGSFFEESIEARGMIYGPVDSWSLQGELQLAPGHLLPPSFRFRFFFDSETLEVAQNNNNDELLELIEALTAQVNSLLRK